MTEETFSLGGHAVPNDIARQLIDFYVQWQKELTGKHSLPPADELDERREPMYDLLQQNGFTRTQASEILNAANEQAGEMPDRLQ